MRTPMILAFLLVVVWCESAGAQVPVAEDPEAELLEQIRLRHPGIDVLSVPIEANAVTSPQSAEEVTEASLLARERELYDRLGIAYPATRATDLPERTDEVTEDDLLRRAAEVEARALRGDG